jgi:glycosyltransferase involved in cell wall biosynthesis
MPDQKQLSVLIPCFNAARWVGGAIRSALEQTYPRKEIIVVDDGSADESIDVIKSFGNAVRWEAGHHRGGNPTRNRLLELARGEWVQYLDADDYLLPDKTARQMDFLALHPTTDVVFGPTTLEHWSETGSHCELLPIPEPHDLWVLLARWYLPQTGASLWRKQAIADVGGWKPDQPCCQEHELYLRLLMAEKRFAYCPSNGAVYRQWDEHTVCKRDKAEVRRRRLDIEERAEKFLRQRGELTEARHWAINQARFEMARIAWQHDHVEALSIVELLRRSQPDFQPAGVAAPSHYQFAWRLLGFRLAETIADWRRRTRTQTA